MQSVITKAVFGKDIHTCVTKSGYGVENGNPHVIPLIISLIITAVSVGATVYIVKKVKKAEEERARKAEARKSRNSRRKI